MKSEDRKSIKPDMTVKLKLDDGSQQIGVVEETADDFGERLYRIRDKWYERKYLSV